MSEVDPRTETVVFIVHAIKRLAFRNRALVHPRYSDSDIDRVYAQVNMLDPDVRADFQQRLQDLHAACLARCASPGRARGSRGAALSLPPSTFRPWGGS